VYRERFKRGNGYLQITDTSSPVRVQSDKRRVLSEGVQMK